MNVSHAELRVAARDAHLTEAQADSLWRALELQAAQSHRPRFDVAHVAYYLG